MTQFEPPVPPEVSAAVTPLPPLDEAAVQAACPGLPPRAPDEALLPRVLLHARDLVLLAAP
ncbi:hypothetical protein [Nitrospirillum sp. BR 11828]|uniref:hypothetical protein n=1 Tax=Nitrospirillum sp. BR 11828 TaxID=3104325 RepID=UPI002ACACD7E|nr:hypothetical protein [Nitrospirillum sp. BR 11828]MDZ5648458.1 hypothetical protein [Nitrospirillum sp. BR 11828]